MHTVLFCFLFVFLAKCPETKKKEKMRTVLTPVLSSVYIHELGGNARHTGALVVCDADHRTPIVYSTSNFHQKLTIHTRPIDSEGA